jgi:hypothetical protein
MTPRDHLDNPEAPSSPQAPIRDLRAQAEALPEALHRQFLAAGAAVVPALIALLEAELADDQAEREGAPFDAVELLGALGDARAVQILLRYLAQDDFPHVSCGHMIYGVDGRESTRLMHYPKVNTTRVRPDLI